MSLFSKLYLNSLENDILLSGISLTAQSDRMTQARWNQIVYWEIIIEKLIHKLIVMDPNSYIFQKNIANLLKANPPRCIFALCNKFVQPMPFTGAGCNKPKVNIQQSTILL